MQFKIPGYHGSFCPPEHKLEINPPTENQQNHLPKGVGLTLDVSTGDLKLPAWSFDFSGNTNVWTDPNSGDKFLLPNGLLLSTDVEIENVANTNVFKSAAELVSVWESGYETGNWLGGEFGNSKDVVDLYEKFFSKQQSTSINQHPKALYRLTLTKDWENHLNIYALAALRALPEIYDSNIYNRLVLNIAIHRYNEK